VTEEIVGAALSYLGHAACKKVEGTSLKNPNSSCSTELKALEILLQTLMRQARSKWSQLKRWCSPFSLLERQSESWRILVGRHPGKIFCETPSAK
jgi:hypothetical protein